MEIEQLRKEINHLLDNVVEHSNSFSDNRQIPSLEISFILTKINKLQESMAVLKHLLEKQEREINKISISIQESNPDELIIEKEAAIYIEKVEPVVFEKIKVENSASSINESVKNVEDNLKQRSIKKLMDAFSLNDRYLFANELFNKDMNAFNELIKSIDNSSTLDEAKEILSKLELDYENEQVLSFLNLVECRFI